MHKPLKTYTPPRCSLVGRANARAMEIIRRERNVIESLRPYSNPTADAMRRSAEVQISIAQETLNASHGAQ